MNAIYLQGEVFLCKQIEISEQLIKEVPEFKKGFSVSSLENLAFIAAGHSALQDFRFDRKTFAEWCKERDFEWFLDEQQAIYHIRLNPNSETK